MSKFATFVLMGLVGLLFLSGCVAPGSGLGRYKVKVKVQGPDGKGIKGKKVKMLIPEGQGLSAIEKMMGPLFPHEKEQKGLYATDNNGEFVHEFDQVFHASVFLIPPIGAFPKKAPPVNLILKVEPEVDECHRVYATNFTNEGFDYAVIEKTDPLTLMVPDGEVANGLTGKIAWEDACDGGKDCVNKDQVIQDIVIDWSDHPGCKSNSGLKLKLGPWMFRNRVYLTYGEISSDSFGLAYMRRLPVSWPVRIGVSANFGRELSNAALLLDAAVLGGESFKMWFGPIGGKYKYSGVVDADAESVFERAESGSFIEGRVGFEYAHSSQVMVGAYYIGGAVKTASVQLGYYF